MQSKSNSEVTDRFDDDDDDDDDGGEAYMVLGIFLVFQTASQRLGKGET